MQLSRLLPLAILALHALPSGATVVVVPTLDEMAVASEVIAEVRVGEARVVEEAKGRLVTYTALEVIDGWKGLKSGDVVEVVQIGGTLHGKSSWIVGAHRFTKGERMVFFGVRSVVRNAVVPYGIGFGLFRVEQDLTGSKLVEIVGDVVALEKGPDGKPVTSAPSTRRYDSLASFKETVTRLDRLEELPKMPTRQKLLPKRSAAPGRP